MNDQQLPLFSHAEESLDRDSVPGLCLVEKYISPEDENLILKCIGESMAPPEHAPPRYPDQYELDFEPAA